MGRCRSASLPPRSLHHLNPALYVPADDLTDPSPATTFGHLDATVVLSRDIAAPRHLPGGRSARLDLAPGGPNTIGETTTTPPCGAGDAAALQELPTSSPSSHGRARAGRTSSRCRARARSSASCAAVHRGADFTGTPGKYVSLKDTIKGFKMIVAASATRCRAGVLHGRPIEEAFEKAKTLKYDMAAAHPLDVVSAEEAIFSGEAEFVVLPGEAASSASTAPYAAHHAHQAGR